MSLFTALVPPPDALRHLGAAVDAVRAAWPELRWVRPERWHVTVTFLGEVPDETVSGLVAATADALADVPAPALRLAGAGEFPGGRRPLRVLWVGVHGVGVHGVGLHGVGGRGSVGPVVAASDEAARASGVRLERRDHVPHLTLARAEGRRRRGVPAPRSGGSHLPVAVGADGPVPSLASYAGPAWAGESVRLLRSRPGRSGSYEEVARFPLGGVKDAARGTMTP